MDKSTLTQRARNLRKNSTAAEVFQQISSILEVIMKAPHPLEIKNREAAQI
jgi:hypothetical protein